jgi:hypothetical protein
MRRFLLTSAVAAMMLVAAAGSAAAQDGGAVVTRDFGCGIFTVPGGGGIISDRSHLVVTPSGNASLVCHGQLPAGAPETISFESVCGLAGGTTTGHNVVTRSGEVHLTCHLKP